MGDTLDGSPPRSSGLDPGLAERTPPVGTPADKIPRIRARTETQTNRHSSGSRPGRDRFGPAPTRRGRDRPEIRPSTRERPRYGCAVTHGTDRRKTSSRGADLSCRTRERTFAYVEPGPAAESAEGPGREPANEPVEPSRDAASVAATASRPGSGLETGSERPGSDDPRTCCPERRCVRSPAALRTRCEQRRAPGRRSRRRFSLRGPLERHAEVASPPRPHHHKSHTAI